MAHEEIPKEEIRWLKRGPRFTDEEIRQLSPKMKRFASAHGRFSEYRMVAEVVEEHHCSLQPKVGDKIVFRPTGTLTPEESTASRFCLWALAPMLPFNYVIYDRIIQGLDPCDLTWDHVTCADTGTGCGGFGQVLFKVYCEKVATKQ